MVPWPKIWLLPIIVFPSFFPSPQGVNLKVAYVSTFTFTNHPDQNSIFWGFSWIIGFESESSTPLLSLSHQVMALVWVCTAIEILVEKNPEEA